MCGRGGEIWTPDILLPKQARYRTALHPEKKSKIKSISNTSKLIFFSAVSFTFNYIWCREGDSNPHNLTVVRFWVWCVYQFHHLGITDIIDEIPILVKTQTIEILPESSSKFLKISSQNPNIVRFW